MFTLAFWKASLERIIASFVGALLAGLGGNVFDVTALDWGQLLKISGGAALVSLLKAVLAATATGGGPSFNNAETLTPDVAAKADRTVVQFDGTVIAGNRQTVPPLVAGPAADVPEGEPVDVVPEGSLGDGLGDAVSGIAEGVGYSSDPKADAAYHGRHEA